MPGQYKKYLKATGLYTVGNIFYKAMSLLLLPIFTRLLSTSSYGIVSTYNSWVTILTIVIGMQLYLTLRSACTDYKKDLHSYISTLDSITLIAAMVMMGIAFFGEHFITIPFQKSLVFLCIIHALFSSVINVELQRQMMSLEYVKRTLLLALPGLIAAVIGILVIVNYPQTDYMGRIVSNVAVISLVGLCILICHYKKGKSFFKKSHCSYGLVLSTPLIFHGLACEVLSSVDRTMITYFRTSAETGVYSVAYTMGMAIKVVTSSAESVWIPWFTSKINEKKKDEINKVAKYYLFLITILCVVAMLCLPEFLKLFAEESYWSGLYIIPPIVLASFIVFLYSLSVDVEYYYKATKGLAVNTFIAAGMNLVLNFIFIPKFGAIAAAFTTVVSYTISFLIHYLKAKKLDVHLFPLKIYIVPIIIAIIGTILAYLTMDLIVLRWGIAITALLMSLLFVVKNDFLVAFKLYRKKRT